MSIKKREIKDSKSESTLNRGKVRHAVKSVHIYPKEGRWAVKSSGASRDSSTFGSKKDAVRRGREIAKRRKNGFVIHNRNGKIQFRDSYGNDPFPPKG